jgi:hypothetical protein
MRHSWNLLPLSACAWNPASLVVLILLIVTGLDTDKPTANPPDRIRSPGKECFQASIALLDQSSEIRSSLL